MPTPPTTSGQVLAVHPDRHALLDADLVFRDLDDVVARVCLDDTPVAGRTVAEVLPEAVEAGLPELARTVRLSGRPRRLVYGSDRGGLTRWFEVRLVALGADLLWIEREITTQRRKEQRLITAQRLESLGRLAGGVAHDFNNLLTAVLASAEELARGGEDAAAAMMGIRMGVERAAELTHQLLAFAEQEPFELRTVDADQVLTHAAGLLRHTLPDGITLELTLPEQPLVVRADPKRLEEVLLSLAINARDAMSAGGRLSLTLEPFPLDGTEGVCFEVRDDGAGIPLAEQSQVFDPYYSTKANGTGLGLSTSRSVIERMGGQLKLSSHLDLGTRVRVWLPRVSAGTIRTPEREGARLLVVEDEPLVQRTVVRGLRARGYEVSAASTGRQALEALSHGLQVDMLVSDVMMPGMRGTELARIVHRDYPAVKVMLVSAYPEGGAIDGLQVDFLPKPYTLDELHARIQDQLTRA